jgi:hypothetical protein
MLGRHIIIVRESVTSRRRSTYFSGSLLVEASQGKTRQGLPFGGSGHLDSRSTTLALPLQDASGLGPEPEEELAQWHWTREHGQARARPRDSTMAVRAS